MVEPSEIPDLKKKLTKAKQDGKEVTVRYDAIMSDLVMQRKFPRRKFSGVISDIKDEDVCIRNGSSVNCILFSQIVSVEVK